MRRFLPAAVAGAVVFAASFAFLELGRNPEDFHEDEAAKIGESFYYHLYFERRDLANPAWSEDFFARTNPPLAKYVFGAALAAAGHSVRDRALFEEFERSWTDPAQLRTRVPEPMLRITRRVSSLYAAALCTLLFLVIARVAGPAAGLLVPPLLLLDPYLALAAQSGLSDSMLLFHLALALPAGFLASAALRRGRTRAQGARAAALQVAQAAVLPGVAIALAAATKLHGALAGPAFAGGVLLAALVGGEADCRRERLGATLFAVAGAALVALALFIALDPYYQQHTAERLLQTPLVVHDWLIKQQLDPGQGLYSLRQQLATAGYFSLLSPAVPLARLLGGAGSWLTALGFATGLVALASFPFSRAPRFRAESAVLIAWLAVCGVVTTLSLATSWDRHLLPSYVSACVVTALGIAWLPRSVWQALRPGPGRARAAISALGGLALAGVLAASPWPVDRGLLDPWTFPELAAASRREGYLRALAAPPGSTVRRRHLGMLLLVDKRYPEAADAFGDALAALPGDRSVGEPAVLEAVLQYELAVARAASGERAAAERAIEAHALGLASIRDGMLSRDPFVRKAFDDLAATRRRAIAELLVRRGV
jgi:hypothetical protein